MKNPEYWAKRFNLLEQVQHDRGAAAFSQIDQKYRTAEREIERKIAAWYQRFADNNGITLQEAQKWLSGKELEEFKWDVNEYIRYGQENAINGTWAKQLENASARFHISRLQALKIQCQQDIEVLFGGQKDVFDQVMSDVYRSAYYHTAFEVQRGIGVGWDFATLDNKTISKIINRPWATDGTNFSDRIWSNKQKLLSELDSTLTQNVVLGQDPQKAIDAISHRLGVSKANAGRLVMTEEAYFASEAQNDCFEELDVEQYEIVATLDSRTSEICRMMDGKVFKMSEWKVGVTAPPFHPWCRTTTVPHFDDEFDVGERAARGEDGKTYYVPANMKYSDWEKAFVQGDKLSLKEVQSDDTMELGIFQKPIESDDVHYTKCVSIFDNAGVDYNPVKAHTSKPSEEDIIKTIAGADRTSGSCASVGMAYIGQKHGLDVRDFRGGNSMETFRSWEQLEELVKIKGMQVKRASGACSLTVGNRLLQQVEVGKEYYLVTGQHASIVRKTAEGVLQYLELQAKYLEDFYYSAGWTNFDKNPRFTLSNRFGCNRVSNPWHEQLDFMVDVNDPAFESDEFKSLLGYINTNIGDEQKGSGGGIK